MRARSGAIETCRRQPAKIGRGARCFGGEGLELQFQVFDLAEQAGVLGGVALDYD